MTPKEITAVEFGVGIFHVNIVSDQVNLYTCVGGEKFVTGDWRRVTGD
jgi:hypothetical protein